MYIICLLESAITEYVSVAQDVAVDVPLESSDDMHQFEIQLIVECQLFAVPGIILKLLKSLLESLLLFDLKNTLQLLPLLQSFAFKPLVIDLILQSLPGHLASSFLTHEL